MVVFKADLHVHTVLSPCGDLEMSPVNIVEEAARKHIDILGITDHNSTKHGALIKQLAEKKGIFVLCGAEVTTKEDVHCLTFFETIEALADFQVFLDVHLKGVKNKPGIFGYQVVVDEHDNIIEEVDTLLISALDQTIDQVEQKVHKLGGLFIPAHIDRPAYGLIGQLGFVPPDIAADAFEISGYTNRKEMINKYKYLAGYTFIKNSDAHTPEQIGRRYNLLEMEEMSFKEVAMALKGLEGRKVKSEK
jgi:3',5'-nucleoside bisphosphate phosphatase